jgi:hypothetical protein
MKPVRLLHTPDYCGHRVLSSLSTLSRRSVQIAKIS